MSSILDALRKLEAAEAPTARPPVLDAPARPSRRAALVLGAGCAFAAGAMLALWLSGRLAPRTEVALGVPPAGEAGPTPAPAGAPSPAPPAPVPEAAAPALETVAAAPTVAPEAAAALVPAPPTAPLTAEELAAEPPRGQEILPEPAAAPPTALAAVPEEPPAPAPRVPEPEPMAEPEPSPPPPADAAVVEDLLPRRPAGAPHVQVSFLVYSRAAERRRVALSLDGASLVTLHEGQAAGGVEVVRILTDRVHLRHDGRMFSVRAGE